MTISPPALQPQTLAPPASTAPALETSNALARSYNYPPAVLVMGPPGSGKTDALTTVLQHPAITDLFVLGTEPRFHESLFDSAARRGVDKDRIHTKFVPPTRTSISTLIEVAKTINQLSYEGLSQLKSGLKKNEYQQFIRFLESLQRFVDDQTGKDWGPVHNFPSNFALAVDSLSGINIMLRDLMVGARPTLAQGEWGVVMNQEESFINEMTSNIPCLFILNAHIEREKDEITGGTKIGVAALGSKLSPKIPRFFSEVISARLEANNYYWSTASIGYDLKKRILPLSDKLEPSFVPIIEAWRKREMVPEAKNA